MNRQIIPQEAIVFDLDGTLWDTSVSIATAWNRVLKKNAIDFRNITEEDIAKVMGLPHEECIRKTFAGLDESTLKRLVDESIREDTKIIREAGGLLYKGVDVGLKALKKDFDLYIVSNCQQGYIENFLDYFSYESLFKDFECWGNTLAPKGKNLKDLLARNQIKKATMVGDTLGDFEAAKQNGLPFIQALYGFGEPIEGCEQVSSFDGLLTKLRSS